MLVETVRLDLSYHTRVDATADDESDRTTPQGIQAQNEADGDRGGRGIGLSDPRLCRDENGDVLEERPVSELRLSKAQAFRRLFHTRKLTAPTNLGGSLPGKTRRGRIMSNPRGMVS